MGLFSEVLDKQKSTRIKHPKVVYSGCLNCPSNKTQEDKIPDYAIFEPIQDKPILVIAMRPAKTETEQGKNLVGKSGQLLWRRAEKLKAFTREQCNTDNVVRCRGTALNENGYEVERAPSKVELKCCDLHTQNRKTKYKPKVVLILGTEAQKQFLGKRYSKKQKTYWDSELKCKVICCLSPRTKIVTYDGRWLNIEQLQVGDCLLGSRGQPVKVLGGGYLSASKQLYGGKAYKIRASGSRGCDIICSPNHEFLTRQGLVEAKDLTLLDYLAYPKRKFAVRKKVSGCYKLSREFGFACGLYLADGSLDFSGRSGRIMYYLHAPKERRLFIRVRKVLANYVFSFRLGFDKRTKNCFRGRVTGKPLAIWLRNNFGMAKSKHVPSWIWQSTPEFALGVLEGWLAGDGYPTRRCITGVGVLPSVVFMMREIAFALGLGGVAFVFDKPKKLNYIITQTGQTFSTNSPRFSICITGVSYDKLVSLCGGSLWGNKSFRYLSNYRKGRRWKQKSFYEDKHYVYFKIRKITPVHCRRFFDIHVDSDDMLYSLPTAVTHNTFHPSFFLRGYGGQEQAWKEFDKALLEVKQTLKYPGRYGFIKSLDIKRLENPVEVEQMFTEFRKQKRFVVFDMEWGTIAQGDGKKKLVILCIAFCNDVGKVRVVFYHHPETTSARVSDLITRRLVRSTCQFLADGSVKKAAWHGISDVRTVKKVWGVDVRGYDIDGEYSEFFVYPNRKDYRLETTTDVRFKQFAGYKDIVNPYVKEEMNFALVPVSVLLLRCGVDALVTRKAILTTLPKTSKALVKMYVQSSFVLEESGSRGMLFDFEHAIRLEKIYGPLLEQLDREISMTAGVPDFDITDTNLRWLLIKKLKLPLTKLTKGASKLVNKKLASESEDGHGRRYEKLDPEDVRRILVELYGEKWWKAYATDKEVMEEMVGEHPIVLKIMQRKFLFKDNSTYIEGFRESARANGGYVKTRFKMTGASSGRISSGGDRANNPSEEKKVNLQNISGDLNTKNMLVSTINWSKIFNSWKLRNQESEEV